MSEKTIIITESEGTYGVQNNRFSEFELIGILECLVFDMKSALGQVPSDKKTDAVAAAASQEITDQPKEASQETSKETVQSSSPSELRTRISNAVKAIKGLGGEVRDVNRSGATDEELQTELEEFLITSRFAITFLSTRITRLINTKNNFFCKFCVNLL